MSPHNEYLDQNLGDDQSNTRQPMHHSRPQLMSSDELELLAILRGTSTGPCWQGVYYEHGDDDDDDDHNDDLALAR